MEIYASLADYLDGSPLAYDPQTMPPLQGKDRPVIVLDPQERLKSPSRFLMPRQDRVYEVGFPWIQTIDWETWESRQALVQQVTLTIEDHPPYSLQLQLQDEVFDASQLGRGEEDTAEQLHNTLGYRCDRATAETIALLIGLFREILGRTKTGPPGGRPLVEIPSVLDQLSQSEAHLPLVLALNRRYELRHKLELIAPKLRSQLNRVAEMMPLGHIQELDAYCLRDYVRRPGRNALEKAGARQQLMAIQRYENFNTAENRFLKGFCDLLQQECRNYSHRYHEAETLERAIDQFRQEPNVQSITSSVDLAGRPNYVLQQNPIYRSFYQAYLDYLQQRSDKEKIWGYRQALLVDALVVYLVAALLQLQGSFISSLSSLAVKATPDYGRYLKEQEIRGYCVLQQAVWSFTLARPASSKASDLVLTATQQLIGQQVEVSYHLSLWVFWYKPAPSLRERLHQASGVDTSLSVYLFDLDQTPEPDDSGSGVQPTLPLPAPLKAGFMEGVDGLTRWLRQWLGGQGL
jgi:hypothetical protein